MIQRRVGLLGIHMLLEWPREARRIAGSHTMRLRAAVILRPESEPIFNKVGQFDDSVMLDQK